MQENGVTEYTVYEDQGPVEVCVVFANTLSEVCPVNFPFYFSLETVPSDTAREFCVCVCVMFTCVCVTYCR